ncbi:unnamed protein product [Ectocarpus sp. 8 AP-2014]
MPSDAVIEVKYHNRRKHGLGQVLAYQPHYPRLAGVCTSLRTSEIKIPTSTSRWRSQCVMRTR